MSPSTILTRGRERKAPRNPYVGARAFRNDNPLFGRDREAWELETLLIAERIVLMHAPSGAGKTSLIQAKLIPSLEGEYLVSGPLRLNSVPPPASEVNPYLRSVMQGLVAGRGGPPLTDGDVDFNAWLAQLEAHQEREDHLLIFDQFEELLTLDPTDDQGHRAFCHQVGESLKAPHRWALFSMREDYMGGLDGYLELIPTQLRVRYRLDFLSRDAAKQAAQEPARAQRVEFSDAAADQLVEQLGSLRVERPGRQFEVKEGFVEPVQLQVVCHTVWARLAGQLGRSFERIDADDVVGYDDYAVALGKYFADTVEEAARRSRVDEGAVRRWFEEELITAKGFRSQAFDGPSGNGGNKDKLLELLEKRYLIRGDERGGHRWYELSHDGLVEPIREDNRRWFRTLNGPWFEFAREWHAAAKDRSLLLRGEALSQATRWLEAHRREADELVVEFIAASHDATTAEHLIASARARQLVLLRVSKLVAGLVVLAVVQTIIIVALLLS